MLVLLLLYTLTHSGFGDGTAIAAIERREASSCNDINSCRTLSNIIWGCFATIFLCTWATIHPNIAFTPEEKDIGRFKKWVTKPLRSFLEKKLPLFLVALFVPEYILAWAIRQYIRAWQIQKKYSEGWTRTHGFFVIMGGFHFFELPASALPDAISSKSDTNPAFLLSPLASRQAEIPKHPLDIDDLPADVLQLISPTESELKDRGKSDTIAKVLALVQTLWFVIQCAARGVRHLPLTELEVVTLAYTMMNFFIYIFWWDKPKDVENPIRVYKAAAADREGAVAGEGVGGTFVTIFSYILGGQDHGICLSKKAKVPMFWSGGGNKPDDAISYAIVAMLGPSIIGIGIGAIHYIVWYAEFPSPAELAIWRISCVGMMIAPLLPFLLLPIVAFADSDWLRGAAIAVVMTIYLFILILASGLYIVARIATIVIAFATLRSLPSAAFAVVDWTTFIPHI